MSKDLYGEGSYSGRMKLPNAPSSIAGFFLYQAPDYASEIDIEIYNDTSRKIMFSTYSGGSQTHAETMALPSTPRPSSMSTASTMPPAPSTSMPTAS